MIIYELMAYTLLLLVIIGIATFLYILKSKNIDIWFIGYIKTLFRRLDNTDKPIHILFCFADHFEPMWGRPAIQRERARVDRWIETYPTIADQYRDADGIKPQHTFFYPAEEYREEHLEKLAALCRNGYGEIEVHYHHDDDTDQEFRRVVGEFVTTLYTKHGALSEDPDTGKPAWAFIHGNWTLCNSGRDGRWCGIPHELPLLKELGCYVDMTLPSAPSETQTKKINSIYYASDIPGENKSHNDGVDVIYGGTASGDLMLIQGPLMLNWKRRKFGMLPKIESGDIRGDMPLTNDRIDLWVKAGVHVKGMPYWRFVKVHTHGAQENNIETVLAAPIHRMHRYLQEQYNDGKAYILHYVTAREMYNIVKAAEAGHSGNPNDYRNYIYKRRPNDLNYASAKNQN